MRTASLITIILLSGLLGCSATRAADVEFSAVPSKPKSSAVPGEAPAVQKEMPAAKPRSSAVPAEALPRAEIIYDYKLPVKPQICVDCEKNAKKKK